MSSVTEEMTAEEFSKMLEDQSREQAALDEERRKAESEQAALDAEIAGIESDMGAAQTYTFTFQGVTYAGCDFCFMASTIGKDAAKVVHEKQYGEGTPLPPVS